MTTDTELSKKQNSNLQDLQNNTDVYDNQSMNITPSENGNSSQSSGYFSKSGESFSSYKNTVENSVIVPDVSSKVSLAKDRQFNANDIFVNQSSMKQPVPPNYSSATPDFSMSFNEIDFSGEEKRGLSLFGSPNNSRKFIRFFISINLNLDFLI